MIDDIATPSRRKPKTIHPLPKQVVPLPSYDEVEQIPDHHQLPTMYAPSAGVDTQQGESVATEDDTELTSLATAEHFKSSKKKHGKLAFSWPPSKRAYVVLGVVAVVIAFGSGAAWTHFHRTVTVSASPIHKHVAAKPKVVVPTTLASTLTGLQVDPAVNQRPVTGVMIENSTDARPQSGLDQAGVVFEAIAEGGITRFLALYQDTTPAYLGPVRSARPYYVQWCMGFDCSLAHVGGSPEALTDIPAWGTKNLDQFANGGSYERISSRYAPHNVYTSMDQLNQLEASKGYGASSYNGFVRKADSPYKAPAASTATTSTTKKSTTTKPATDSRTPASTIDMAISAYDYNTHYDYDAATNTYKRSEGGAAHMELNKDGSQTQIAPKVVIAMVMQYGLEADDHHSQYNVIGSGAAYVFQDGTVTTGTWSKADMKTQVTFKDSAGAAIKLDAGQTWLTALSDPSQVTYK